MGTVMVKYKIMPSSPEVNLIEIQEKTKSLIEESGGKNCQISEEPIAFGLKAIVIFFAWPEEKEIEPLEEEIGKIENISSVQLVDMRRAIG